MPTAQVSLSLAGFRRSMCEEDQRNSSPLQLSVEPGERIVERQLR